MKNKILIVSALVIAAGCTKLDEHLGSQTTAGSGSSGGVTVTNLLAGTYDAMRLPYQDQTRVWAAEQLNDIGGLPRDNSGASVEQSDAMCQLLRLLILCYSDLVKLIDESSLTDMIKKLHMRILEFCIISGNDDRGSVKYQLGFDTACSWCTMFCLQALRLWQKNMESERHGRLKGNVGRFDYFV